MTQLYPQKEEGMTRPAGLRLAVLLFAITAISRSEVLMSTTCEQPLTTDVAKAISKPWDTRCPVPVVPWWTVSDEDSQSPYGYRDRSRDTERNRKLGRSRDERGDDSQQSIIRGGAWTESNGIGPDPGEDSDPNISQEEKSSEKTEEEV
jgi:hypothetical protein